MRLDANLQAECTHGSLQERKDDFDDKTSARTYRADLPRNVFGIRRLGAYYFDSRTQCGCKLRVQLVLACDEPPFY